MTNASKTKIGYNQTFGEAMPRVFFAPGRVNLIGEHIDYSGGLVLPCALDVGTYVAISPRQDNQIMLASADSDAVPPLDCENTAYRPENLWGNYPLAIVHLMKQAELPVAGFNAYYHGTVPRGAGLSSSASLSMVSACALAHIFGHAENPVAWAQMCQAAEALCGVKCGIMDPFVSALGRRDCAILLNCENLEYKYIPLNLGDKCIVVANTAKPRALADGEYNLRRTQCEAALADLRTKKPIPSLCSMDIQTFDAIKDAITDDIARKRAQHAVYENHRTQTFAAMAAIGNWDGAAMQMWQSHDSLRDLYDVSCPELDSLVAHAKAFGLQQQMPYKIAARLTGAGFGGCTVNIVKRIDIEDFSEYVGKNYTADTGLAAEFYVVNTANGVREFEV